jgi:hypothetical protein
MEPTSSLTARQRAFLDKLLELYREHKGPVHYSAVAERLGVNRFSAYDMLRVLEEKGFASSSYALADGHSGPGRSLVVFAPTSQAVAVMLAQNGDEARLGEDWPTVRERVLSRLRRAREANPRELLNELLTRLPEASAPLTFCTEMIGALLLNMQRVRAKAGGLNPFRALAALRTGDAAQLETLAGLSVGVALSADDEAGEYTGEAGEYTGEADPSLAKRLLVHAHRYQTSLSRLSAEARSALVQFLEEALEALD